MRFASSMVVMGWVVGLTGIAIDTQSDDMLEPHVVRVEIQPETTTVMLGIPASIEFHIHNDSDRDLIVEMGGHNRNALGRPNAFRVSIKDVNGEAVFQPDAGGDFGGISWLQTIAAGESHSIPLYLPNWARFEDEGEYDIEISRTLRLRQEPREGEPASDQLIDLDVKTSGKIHVTPYDDSEMVTLLEDLERDLFVENSDIYERAMRDLQQIDDTRAIPILVSGLETKRYGIQFSAIHALGKFEDPSAFEALKRAMRLTADDVENVSNRDVAIQLAINLRHAGAVALSSCPHPNAIPFLLTCRDDESEAVKITILHVLGQMDPERALPLLREMSDDKNERVKNEAERYIELLSSD